LLRFGKKKNKRLKLRHINQSLKHAPSKELILTGNRILRVGPCQLIIITSCYEWWAHFYWVSLKMDGPIPSTIYCFMLRAHGPIHIESHSEWWAHTLNYIFCSAWSIWAHSLNDIFCHARNNGPILSIIYFVPLGAHGPIYIVLHSEQMGPDIFCYAQSIWAHSYSVMLCTMGPYSQLYIMFCSEHMGPFVFVTLWAMGPWCQWYIVLHSECISPFISNYALNNGPILSIIYSVLLRAYGPSCILSCSEWWAHAFNDILCYVQNIWAHSS
jgi:hypothetical protein